MSNTPRKIKIDSKNKPYCPNCYSGEYIFNLKQEQNSYCGDCGQRLDWGEFEQRDCLTCKHIIECNLDKQAFYKFMDKQCEGWEKDERQTNE